MYQDICPDLIVRTDTSFTSHWDHKNVSTAECKAKKEGRSCKYRGLCIAAYDEDGKRVSSKN